MVHEEKDIRVNIYILRIISTTGRAKVIACVKHNNNCKGNVEEIYAKKEQLFAKRSGVKD